jgi:Mg-chelatase subunit ChlD
VSLSVALRKLREIEPSSYTPMASAIRKTMTMIHQEQIKGVHIPVIIIMSDLGANISKKFPDLNTQTQADFRLLENELDEIATEVGKKQIKMIIMKPQKSFATRYLGVNPISVQRIQQSFMRHANARIFEFDAYDPENTIVQLKRVLD